MNLKELLEAVKEEALSKELIEKYRDALIHIHTKVCIERAELKKTEAFFFINSKEESDIAKKRAWRVTPEGQRLLEIEAYKAALPKEIDSLRSRIYSLL